jgi:hypothetical protein
MGTKNKTEHFLKQKPVFVVCTKPIIIAKIWEKEQKTGKKE